MVWPVRGCGVGACGPSGDHDPRSTGHDRRAVLMLTTLANVVATRQAVSRAGNPPRRLAARLRPWGDAPGVRARLDDVELRLLAQLPSRLSVDQIAGDLRIPAREAEHPDPLRVPELGVRRRCGGVRARIATPDQPPALAAHMTSPPFGRPHAWRNGPTRQAVIDFVRRTCGGDGSAPCRSRNGSRSSTTMAPVGARSRGRPQTRRYRRMDRCRHERPDNRLLTTRTGPALAVAAAHLIALGRRGPQAHAFARGERTLPSDGRGRPRRPPVSGACPHVARYAARSSARPYGIRTSSTSSPTRRLPLTRRRRLCSPRRAVRSPPAARRDRSRSGPAD
jgi:hypothetical protein